MNDEAGEADGMTACRPARYVLVCHPEPGTWHSAEFTSWDTRAEAEQASVECYPCSPRCIGVHTVVPIHPGMAAARTTKLSGVLR